ncbi:MAG: hypothetical protein F6K09_35415, partial [Merismopedia sp. SIO2A8]|nr:hypothetical protein [Merismopedia sp. SIO2A8]
RPDPILAITWQQTAQSYQGQNQDQTFYCPGNGQVEPIWGSDVYGAESSICTAAVHAGLITVENGGAIAIRSLSRQDRYLSTHQNGITSAARSSSAGSFTFTSLHDPIAGVVTVKGQSVPIQVTSWETTAEGYRNRQGDAIALYCPPNGALAPIWGTTQYRDTSSICTAAVHANRLTPAAGGAIAFEMTPNQSRYTGSTHQGVTSQSFGQSFSLNQQSFVLVPFES